MSHTSCTSRAHHDGEPTAKFWSVHHSLALRLLHRVTAATLAAFVAVGASHTAALAQDFPHKPIRLLIGTPPGGPLDVLARIVGERASRTLGQPVIVESKIGGTGIVAKQYLIQQPPDGYTLHLSATAAFTLTPLLRKEPYKPIDPFTFVGRIAFTPSVFAVPAALPAKTLQEFVALAKSQPGKLSYGTIQGTPQHIDFEKFKRATGTDVIAVSYPGGAPIVNAMLGMHLQATLLNSAIFTEYVKSGKVRVLATTAARRLPYFPDAPTMAEAGFPNVGLDEGVYYGVIGPAGMPKPVVDKLYQALSEALADPETARKLAALGMDVSPREGSLFRQDMERELAANEKSVKALDIKMPE